MTPVPGKKSKKSAKKVAPKTKKKAKKKLAKKTASRSAKKTTGSPAKKTKPRVNLVKAGPGGRLFEEITDRLRRSVREVTPGPMMSSPGIRWKGKVFAFYNNNSEHMVFRLGKEFDPEAAGLRDWKPLNPFKNKGPLPGWFVVPYSEKSRWSKLADQALAQIRTA